MKTFKTMLLLVGFFVLAACNKSSSNNADSMNAQCMANPALCYGNVYNQGYGFSPWGYNNGYGYSNIYYNGNSAYLCNCPAGMVPTYNTYGGLGCVQANMMGGFYGYAYFGLYGGASNNHWLNIPQISNHTGYAGAAQTSCYNGVVQSCIIDQPQSCSPGYTCRATSAQSRIGLCVSNSGQQGTGAIYR